MTDVEY